jgi:hypothetical protein
MMNKIKQETPEYTSAYNMLNTLPKEVIRDWIWENDYDWVIKVGREE